MINAPVTSTVTEIVAQVSADGTTITPQVVRQEQVVAVVVQMGVKGDKGDPGAVPLFERRADWVDPVSYCGKAPDGSDEGASVWEISKITIALDGGVTVASASGIAWSDRYSIL